MKRISQFTVFGLFIMGALCLQGCSSTATPGDGNVLPTGDRGQNHRPTTAERTKSADAADSADSINAQAMQRAERLQRELDRLKAEHGLPSRQDEIDRKFADANAQPRKIDFVAPNDLDQQDLNPERKANFDPATVANNRKPDATIDDNQTDNDTQLVANPSPEHIVQSKASAQPAAINVDSLDRKTLTKMLAEKIVASNDPNTSNIIALAGLALADQDGVIDPLSIEGLKPSERQLVQQFQSLFTQVSQRMAKGEAIDKNSVIDQINSIIGEQPLSIRKLKLCSRVRGYGVFDELPATTLLAGREHPFIVYAELDNFSVRKSEKNLYNQQVKLSQELVLYSVADGLAVWRQPEQAIVDESRNRRRDFFTVQPTRLPSRLGAGKYVLKVRVRDKHAGTVAEESIDINVVADPSLVKPNVNQSTVRPG